jgi:hypothetical protein
MSYDIWLTIDTGGPAPAPVGGSLNMTSNVAPMWRLAGADLAEFKARTAGDCIPELRTAIADMAGNPEKYRPLNPSNGWGDYAGCLEFLRELLVMFEEHPKATVEVWR